MTKEVISPKAASDHFHLINHDKPETFNVPLDEKQLVFLSELVDSISPDTNNKLKQCRNVIKEHLLETFEKNFQERYDLEEACQELDKLVQLIEIL